MLARAAYATNFFLAAGIGVVFVFLADLQERYDLSDWQFGVLASSGFVAALITQLGLSPLVDRGVVKPFAYLAIVLGSFGTIAFAFADSFVTLSLARALVGVALGLFGATARKAILGLDLDGGGKKVGTLLSTGVGGFILGPLIGAVFGRISFGAPFLFIGACILVVGLPAARLVAAAPVDATEVDYGDLRRLLRTTRVQSALLVQMIIFVGIGVFDAILDRYLTDLSISTDMTAVVLLVIGAPMLVLPRFAGDLSEKWGGARVVLPGLVLIIPAIAIYGLAGGAVAVICVGLAQGIGESFAGIAAQMMVLEEAGTERAAIGNAAMEATGMTTATLAALAAPLVYGEWGARVLFFGTAVIALCLATGVLYGVIQIQKLDAARSATTPALASTSPPSD